MVKESWEICDQTTEALDVVVAAVVKVSELEADASLQGFMLPEDDGLGAKVTPVRVTTFLQ